jgi:hypothetical protein
MSRPITRLLVPCLVLAVPAVPADRPSPSAPLALFAVEAGALDRRDTPVWASLEGLEVGSSEGLELYEVSDGRRVLTPSQIEPGFDPRLWWVLAGTTSAGTTRTFELARGAIDGSIERTPAPAVDIQDDGDSLTVVLRDRPVLRYRYTTLPPQDGASPLYARSGFIHPLWSPGGEVLTRIQPPDHLHHVGLWNPWTHTEFEGREIDFWNLVKGEGTVRFKELLSTTVDRVYGGFRALHEHVDLTAPDPSGAKVALKEEWQVRVWARGPSAEGWLIDFVSSQSCATQSPLTVKAYRYQGFGFRATAAWGDETATIRTSEGKDKSNANATRARWCDVRGVAREGTAGVVFMSHPANFNHPEPLRIWPTGMNDGKENVFLNFNPAQDRDWVLEPGRTYTLRYRMLVYDGEVSAAVAERYWDDLAHPPRVTRE